MRLCLLLSAALALTAAESRRVVQPAAGGKNSWKPHKPLHIASELKSPQQHRGARNTNFANQNSYGGPPEASEPVDLHNKEFCVDVSTYQPVVWVEREAESCETVFVKQCSDRSENVCQDVTETKCEVVPYKECKAGQEPQQFSETKLAAKKFIEKECEQSKKRDSAQKAAAGVQKRHQAELRHELGDRLL